MRSLEYLRCRWLSPPLVTVGSRVRGRRSASVRGATARNLVPVGSFSSPVYLAAAETEPESLYVVEQAGPDRARRGRQAHDLPRHPPGRPSGGEQGLLGSRSTRATPRTGSSTSTTRRGTATRSSPSTAPRREARPHAHAAGPRRPGGEPQRRPAPVRAGRLPLVGQRRRRRRGRPRTGTASARPATSRRSSASTSTSRRPRWLTWAVGLRNPWRFSFDRAAGALYIGDVGQNAWEEIDYVPSGRSHLNFGWNRYEGDAAVRRRGAARGLELDAPIARLRHDDGCSVTGGYVYRGKQIQRPSGRYFFGDYCSGTVWSLQGRGRQGDGRRTEPFDVQGCRRSARTRRASCTASLNGPVYWLAP